MLFDAFDNIPISFFIIENDIIVDCNLNAVNLFEYTNKENLLGLEPFALSPYTQDDGTESYKKGEHYIREAHINKHVNFTWQHSKRNGETFLAYINLISIKNVLFALITNLDEVKNYEAKLQENDQMYKLLFEQNKSIILIVDLKTLFITDANQAAEDFYGYNLAVLKTKKYPDLLMDTENLDFYIEQVMTNKRNIFFTKHKLANGEIHDVEARIFLITINNIDYLISMIYDSSEKIKQNLIINTFINQSPYPIAVLDNRQRVININDKFTTLFLYDQDEIIGKNLNELLTTLEHRDELEANIDKVFTENFIRVTTLRKKKDNTLIDVEIFAFPITYNDKIIGAYVHYIDITEKIKNQTQLELFKKALENNNEGIMITDIDENIEWVNHAFTKITGYTLAEISGKKPQVLRSEMHKQDFYRKMWDSLEHNNHWYGEIWNKNKFGEVYPEWLNIYAIKNNGVITNYVGIFKDLSESKIIDQKMRVLAQKDALTGLYNRVYFTEKLTEILEKQKMQKHALLFLDLNHFKDINDTLGHHVGDEFLVTIANRIVNYCDDNTLIARYGGDEFVILFSDYQSLTQITDFVEKIALLIKEPYDYKGNLLYVSASIGVSLYPEDGTTYDELIQNADIAMYVAKDSLEQKIFYYTHSMRIKIDEKFKIASLLREAIDNKAYYLMFEPVYNLQTNKVVSAGVNLIWRNEVLNAYPKDRTSEVALETGQINQIFADTFEDICKLLLDNKTFSLPLSLNISLEQLEQSQFLTIIKTIIAKYQINNHLIEFQFTDKNYHDLSKQATKNINYLLSLGFNFCFDSFGDKHSAIAELKYYQVKKIYLAPTLLKADNEINNNYELIKLYQLIANKMKLQLIAKGIESEKQLMEIKKLNIIYGQGIYLSKLVTFSYLINHKA